MVLAALVLATLVATLDTQIVSTALPTIVGDLGGINRFAWVSTAYLLTLSVTTVLGGKLGDLLGRKPVFLGGIVIFVAGSALCGLAQTMDELIGFRAVQGVGAGALTVSVFGILGDLFESRERARYQSLFAAVFAISGLLGPLLGGALTQHVGWRSIFYLNIPISGLIIAGITTRLHLPSTHRQVRLDIRGALTLAGAFTCLLLLTSQASSAGWTSPLSLGLLTGALALTVVWVLAERRATEPVIPLGLFRVPAFTGAAVIAFVGGAASLGLVSYLALFLQQATGATATNAGLLLIPGSVGIVAGNMVAGRTISRTGRYKAFLVASMSLGLVAVALLATMTPQTSRLQSSTYFLIYGFAAGLSQQVVIVAAQAVAPRTHLGAATGAVTFARLAGSTIAIAVYGSILATQLAHQLATRVPHPALTALHGGSLTPNAIRHLPTAVQHDVAQAYAHALTTAYTAAIPALAFGLLLALALRAAPIPPRGDQHFNEPDTKDATKQAHSPARPQLEPEASR